MHLIEAILLGLIQGLTEFLPVSSSGHLELAKHILGIEAEADVTFTVALHGATVLSTIFALWGTITRLIRGWFRFRWNAETQFLVRVIISMVPIGFVGVLFRKQIESLFTGNLFLVGSMLILTAMLLFLSSFLATRKSDRPVGYWGALLMGIGQACAVMPGLSRSGSTISVGLLCGDNRKAVTEFSFLMVIPVILGANLLEILDNGLMKTTVSGDAMLTGVMSAFISGYFACRWMLSIVRRGKLWWFAIYCTLIGVIAIAWSYAS